MSQYTVKRGDTLWSIAENLLGDGNRYREIQRANNLRSDVTHPGDVLTIPRQGRGTTPHRNTSRRTTPHRNTSRPTTPRRSTSRGSTSRRSTSRGSTSRGSSSRRSTSRGSSSRRSTSRGSTSRRSTSRGSTSRGSSSRRSTSRGSSSRRSTSRGSTSRRSTPHRSTHRHSTPHRSTKHGSTKHGATSHGINSISKDEFDQAVTSNKYPSQRQKCNDFKRSCKYGNIETKSEAAMYLATLLHESDGLRVTKEYYNPVSENAYGRYIGRGYIQLSSEANYRAASNDLGVDYVRNPEQVEDDPHAWNVSAWYWKDQVHQHVNGGFRATVTRGVRPLEPHFNQREEIYRNVCQAFNVAQQL